MRVLIVGQAPGPNTDPLQPLSGRSGRRLASLCCLTLDEFLAAYDRVNLVPVFPGKLAKGDAFPLPAARRFAVAIMRGRRSPLRLVLLGGNVARAFGVPDAPRFAWGPLGRHLAAVFPHPSGVCQFWNDPRNVGQARSFWLRLEQERARRRHDSETAPFDVAREPAAAPRP